MSIYAKEEGMETSSMLISKTIVHWAIEWLYYYEEWAYSGRWYGGGHGKWDVMKS